MDGKNNMRNNPLIEGLLYQIRDPKTSRKDFREHLERIGEYIGIEIANDMEQEDRIVTTSLGEAAKHRVLKENPVLIGVLRAGLPLYQGVQRALPRSQAGFIGARRDEKTLKSEISYCAIPRLRGKTVVLIDTMLATGGSLIDIIEIIKEERPKKIITASVIASQNGIERIKAYDPEIRIYSAAIDPVLNKKGYIVPGLGDAGDRCYGRKI